MLSNILRPKFHLKGGIVPNPNLIWILALGLVLRLISINQSLWLDEATSVLVARDFSFSQILTQFSPGDFHPPLYYLMLHFWVFLLGSTEVAVRMLSVLFGVATIWVVHLVAEDLTKQFKWKLETGKWKLPEVAALLLATSGLHIYYSQEARMYVPAAFFAALSVLFFLRILQKKPAVSEWVGLVLSGALLLYTDYLPGFIFIFFATYLVFFERVHLRKHLTAWAGLAATIVALFLPWIPTLLTQFRGGLAVKTSAPEWWSILGRTSFKQLALLPLKFMVGRIPVDSDAKHVFALTVPGVVFTGLFLKAARTWKETKFLWLWLLVPITLVALVGLRLSVFSYFRLLFVLPAFYLLLSYAALSFRRQNIRALAVVGLLAVNLISTGIYLFNPRLHREDWRGAAAFIKKNSEGNSAAIFVSNGQQEAYKYYSGTILSYGPAGLEKDLDTIWLMRYVQPIFDPQDSVRSEVEERGYTKVREHDFNGVVVWEYKR